MAGRKRTNRLGRGPSEAIQVRDPAPTHQEPAPPLALEPTLKYCRTGKHLVSVSRFYRATRNSDGLRHTCKGCEQEQQRTAKHAVPISIRLQAHRKTKRIYHSQWNPTAKTAELRLNELLERRKSRGATHDSGDGTRE